MSEPIYGAATEEMWQRIPEHFRRMDSLNGWAMKKYINLVGVQVQEIDDLIDQIDYNPIDDGGEPGETSELVNPHVAQTRWLPWLAQLFGITLLGEGNERDRDVLIQAASGFNAGTSEAIAAAAKSVLIGEKYSVVYPHSTSTGIGDGGLWDLLLVTRDEETLVNLYPLIQATIAETVSWVPSTSPSATITKKVERVDPELLLYNNAAMAVTNTAGPTTDLTLNSTHKVEVTATDWYQTMITLWSQSGDTYTGTLGIKYYDSGGVELDADSDAISIAGTPTQFNYGLVAPASSTHMTTYISVDDVPEDEVIYLAQLGARHEEPEGWIFKTADPVQTVIDKGAKPAGFILWGVNSAADWDTVLAEFPTWDEVDGSSWDDLEESGS